MKRRVYVPEGNLDRWMISYSDFVTLLFACFVVMYASVNLEKKNEEIVFMNPKILDDSFDKTSLNANDIQLDWYRSQIQNSNSIIQKPIEIIGSQQLTNLTVQLRSGLTSLLHKNIITIDQRDEGIEIDIDSGILFHIGEAESSKEARSIIAQISYFLQGKENLVRVEGHTDNIPIFNEKYPSNWELSSARAASIVRLMIQEGVEPKRLTAVGLGEHRPKYNNGTSSGKSKNRRVSIFVLPIRSD